LREPELPDAPLLLDPCEPLAPLEEPGDPLRELDESLL
jgi:hypothetical protein